MKTDRNFGGQTQGSSSPDRMHGDLMPVVPHLLQLLVVGVLVGDVKRGLMGGNDRFKYMIAIVCWFFQEKLSRTFTHPYGTTVGVLPVAREQHLVVQIPVVLVDGVVKGQHDHLGRFVPL